MINHEEFEETPTDTTNQYSIVGKPYCCAWWNGPGEIKVHFRSSELARKFQKGKFDAHTTDWGVAGGYLRGFTVKGKSLNWFKRWLSRNDQPK
jgi:hypothetical protein